MRSLVVIATFQMLRSHAGPAAAVLGTTDVELSHHGRICSWTCQTAGAQSLPPHQASSVAPGKFGGGTGPHPSSVCLSEQTCSRAYGLCSGRSTSGLFPRRQAGISGK